MRCLRLGDLKQQNLCSLLRRPEILNRVSTGLVFSEGSAEGSFLVPRLPAALGFLALWLPHSNLRLCPHTTHFLHLSPPLLSLLRILVTGFRAYPGNQDNFSLKILNNIYQDPSSKSGHIHRVWELGQVILEATVQLTPGLIISESRTRRRRAERSHFSPRR